MSRLKMAYNQNDSFSQNYRTGEKNGGIWNPLLSRQPYICGYFRQIVYQMHGLSQSYARSPVSTYFRYTKFWCNHTFPPQPSTPRKSTSGVWWKFFNAQDNPLLKRTETFDAKTPLQLHKYLQDAQNTFSRQKPFWEIIDPTSSSAPSHITPSGQHPFSDFVFRSMLGRYCKRWRLYFATVCLISPWHFFFWIVVCYGLYDDLCESWFKCSFSDVCQRVCPCSRSDLSELLWIIVGVIGMIYMTFTHWWVFPFFKYLWKFHFGC